MNDISHSREAIYCSRLTIDNNTYLNYLPLIAKYFIFAYINGEMYISSELNGVFR
jgi:hypothetical protein